jgi:hypothetical protein
MLQLFLFILSAAAVFWALVYLIAPYGVVALMAVIGLAILVGIPLTRRVLEWERL